VLRRLRLGRFIDGAATRCLDLVAATILLALLSPVIAITAAAIKLEAPGPVFFRCRRVGFDGRSFDMLKFRKMFEGASGGPLTVAGDNRLTRVGSVLARLKLDEIPQLWNVVRGEMALVGPRPEDPLFVALHPDEYGVILSVKPGITGLCQLAFARESEILDANDPVTDYVERLLPQKVALDRMYAERRSFVTDLRLLMWTGIAILLRRDVAVHRATGRASIRRRRQGSQAAIAPAQGDVQA
jgi:lipopolysaccharide/colanic/teichoic acid biosynthesis glycosyltransferase